MGVQKSVVSLHRETGESVRVMRVVSSPTQVRRNTDKKMTKKNNKNETYNDDDEK